MIELNKLKNELKKELLSLQEHKELSELFPKVKTRCPVCYIKGFIENNIDSVFAKYTQSSKIEDKND